MNLEKLTYYLLIVLLFFLLLVPTPLPILPVDLVKRFGFALLLTGGFIIWLLSSLQAGRLNLPKSSILGGLAAIGLVTLVSAGLAPDPRPAFVGSSLEITTAWLTILLIATVFLVAQIFNTRERIIKWYTVLILGTLVTIIFQIAHIFLPSLPSVWSWSDFGLICGFLTASILITFELGNPSAWRGGKLVLGVGGILIFLVTIFTALPFTWWVLGILALVLFVWPFLDTKNASRRILRPSMIVLAVAFIILAINSNQNLWSQTLSHVYTWSGISSIDLRPSWSATTAVLNKNLRGSPLLGTGPNSFSDVWNQFKPTDPRSGALLDYDLAAGYSLVLTLVATLGILGGAAWFVFFAFMIWSGWEFWRKPPAESMARTLAAVVYGGVWYWWATAFLIMPGAGPIVLMFTTTGIWVGLMISLKRTRSWLIVFGRNQVAGAVTLFVVVALVLFGLFTFYNLGSRAYGWFNYSRLMTRLQSGGNVEAAAQDLSKLRSIHTNEIFDRAAVELNNLLIRDLPNQKSLSADELRAKFTGLVTANVSTARAAIDQHGANYANWLTLGSVYETIMPFGVEAAANAASQAYLEAGKRNPQSTVAYLALARLALTNQNFAEARDYARQALVVQPGSVPAILLLAQIETNQGSTKEAIGLLEQAVLNNPTEPRLWFALGYLRFEQSDYETAAAALTQAVHYNPTLPESHYFLGLAYDKLNRREEALRELNLLIFADPNNESLKSIIADIEAGHPAPKKKK